MASKAQHCVKREFSKYHYFPPLLSRGRNEKRSSRQWQQNHRAFFRVFHGRRSLEQGKSDKSLTLFYLGRFGEEERKEFSRIKDIYISVPPSWFLQMGSRVVGKGVLQGGERLVASPPQVRCRQPPPVAPCLPACGRDHVILREHLQILNGFSKQGKNNQRTFCFLFLFFSFKNSLAEFDALICI